MSGHELARLCKVWQRRLRLADWEIHPMIVTVEESPDALGETTPDTAEMRADVRVRDFDETEATLVHELLHIRLLPLWDGDAGVPNHEEREQAINLLADCFMRAYRRKR